MSRRHSAEEGVTMRRMNLKTTLVFFLSAVVIQLALPVDARPLNCKPTGTPLEIDDEVYEVLSEELGKENLVAVRYRADASRHPHWAIFLTKPADSNRLLNGCRNLRSQFREEFGSNSWNAYIYAEPQRQYPPCQAQYGVHSLLSPRNLIRCKEEMATSSRTSCPVCED